jgi:hypothetical protein
MARAETDPDKSMDWHKALAIGAMAVSVVLGIEAAFGD